MEKGRGVEGWQCVDCTLSGNCPVGADDNHEKHFSCKSPFRLKFKHMTSVHYGLPYPSDNREIVYRINVILQFLPLNY